MAPEQLRVHLRRIPFVPLHGTMNSGRTFEVRHPVMAWVHDSPVVVYKPISGTRRLDWDEFSLALIESLTPLRSPN